MKNYSKLLSLIVIVAGVVISCSKSDPAPTQAQLLVGNWTMASIVVTGCTDTANNGAETCTSSCTTLAITATTLTITTPVPGAANSVQAFTYTVSGSTIVTTPASVGTSTFLVAGTALTITVQNPATGTEANCKTVMTFTKV